MFNNRFGVMLGTNYDVFSFKENNTKTNYVRTSLEAVINMGDVLHFDNFAPWFGMLVHGGLGMSNMWQKGRGNANVDGKDPLFKGVDDMWNGVVGVRPQFKVAKRISLNLDLSFIFHVRQTMTFDMTQKTAVNGGFNGNFVNLSLGASFYLGKNEEHADWTPTDYGKTQDLAPLEERIKQLEEANKDDDGDGVPNGRDEESDTPEGSYVDSNGKSIPDADGDGIKDDMDKCPNEAGVYSNDGCPAKEEKSTNTSNEEIEKNETKISFESNSSKLDNASNSELDRIAEYMKENKDTKVNINGYADDRGGDKFNVNLSKRRAEAVADYLRAKGIDPYRISVKGMGEQNPISNNDTEEGRAANRRVEIIIVN